MISRLKIKSCIVFAAFLLVTLLAPRSAHADIFKLGKVGLWQTEEPLTYQFVATGPAAAFNNAEPSWPDGCTSKDIMRRVINAQTSQFYTLSCLEPLNAEQTIVLSWNFDGIRYSSNVAGELAGISLVPINGTITLPINLASTVTRPVGELAKTYTLQGVEHIWFGWDHLVFVLCLCFLFSGRTLIGLVTVFTIGHSITLGLSYFDYVGIAMPPVEALIALSIVFMAREAIKQKQLPSNKTLTTSIVIISLFGLLHGLGFASALSELGAAPDEKLMALLFFNLGVEIGQIAFIAVVVPLQAIFNSGKYAAVSRLAILTIIGCLGGFWTIERISGF